MRLVKLNLSILFIFQKNQLLASLVFYIFVSIFYILYIIDYFIYFCSDLYSFFYSLGLFVVLFLVPLGVSLESLF